MYVTNIPFLIKELSNFRESMDFKADTMQLEREPDMLVTPGISSQPP